MHDRLHLLAHIIVLIADLYFYRPLAILLIDLAYQMLDLAFAALEACAVVVTDNVLQGGLLYAAVHGDQMVKSFIPLCMLGCLPTRQHAC